MLVFTMEEVLFLLPNVLYATLAWFLQGLYSIGFLLFYLYHTFLSGVSMVEDDLNTP